MTLPSASRPGDDPRDTPRRPADSDEARVAADVPAGAVTLADLIADAGPLPSDAALECVQQLAELLARTPAANHGSLDATHVLIDDDGGLWLRDSKPASQPPEQAASAGDDLPASSDGMNRIGRLLVYLVSGDGRYLAKATPPDPAAIPDSISTITSRLFSCNGSCYRSYAEVADDAANIRNAASPSVSDKLAPEIPAPAPSSPDRTLPSTPDEIASDGGTAPGFVPIALAAIAVAAAIAFAVWRWL